MSLHAVEKHGLIVVRKHVPLSRGPITKEDNRVHSSGKVHSWKTCTTPMGAVYTRKLGYKQKMDKRIVTRLQAYKVVWVVRSTEVPLGWLHASGIHKSFWPRSQKST